MGAADEAYRAAVAEIERVRAEGGTELFFNRDAFRALDRIPREIEGMEWLTSLDLANTQVADLARLAGLTALQTLLLNNTQVADLAPLAGLTALQRLRLANTQVADLAPLAGLTALQWLGLENTQVADLAPLVGLTALQWLGLENTQVTDLAPLAGLTALQTLWLANTQVADLAPLAGLTALQRLRLDNTQVADLAPLAGLTALQTLALDKTQVADLARLAGLTALQTLWLDNTQVADLAPLAGLTALQWLRLDTTRVADLADLAGLTALQVLGLSNTQVADLTPLAGLTALQTLGLANTEVADLAPLAGLTALQTLGLANTEVADLAPLAGLTALQWLGLENTQVTDLAPLAGLTALQTLRLNNTQVADLAPLAGLTALQTLRLNNTQVADLAPLAGLTALQTLALDKTQVADLAPLAGLTALQTLWLDETQVADLRPIRNMREPRGSSEQGLDFARTPFAQATAETRRLAAIEDRAQRTRETLAFLKTLPPWPEPLPWEVREPEPLAPPLEPDPAMPLVMTEAGIDLAPTGLSGPEAADPMAAVLHDELLVRAEELVRFGNRDETVGRFGERLTGLLRGGLATLDPLRLHLLIEELRRYHNDERARLDPEVRRALANTLDIGPGLTLGSPAVVIFVARVAANLQARREAAQVAAEIRLTEGIATAEITAPTLQRVAQHAKDRDREDQFTAIRPALTRNFVLMVGKVIVGSAAVASFGHFVTTGHPGWLAAHAADILIAARGWGAPYVAWIAPILDRAQLMVEGARHAGAVLRDRLDRRD